MKKRKENEIIAYKTAVFQIHAPTKRRRALLHDAMYRYHLGFTKILDLTLKNIDGLKTVEKKKFNGSLTSLIQQPIKCLPLPNSAKSGLAQDISGTISAYLELLKDYEDGIKNLSEKEIEKKGGRPGLPSIPRLISVADDWDARLKDMGAALTFEDENTARDKLLKESKAGKLRPMLFPRYRVEDGFVILKNRETERYYVFLNLHSSDSRWAKKKQVNLTGLTDLRNGKVLSQRTRVGELFSINFGKDYQLEAFIKRAVPKTAKLIKKIDTDGSEYFEIHVSFEFSSIAKDTRCFLGVDRGINNLASLCVIGQNGEIVSEENVDGGDLRFVQRKLERQQRLVQSSGKKFRSRTRLAEAGKAVHSTANRIVALAEEHSAQVILEDLNNFANRRNKRRRSNFNRMLNRTQYQKLAFVLDYKLQISGLPKCRRVQPKYTSITCPECGFHHKANRDRGDRANIFNCQECGYRHDADLNAARVIALKRRWRASLPEQKAKKRFEELVNTDYSFKSYLKLLADKRNR